jgi:hypothetical protein
MVYKNELVDVWVNCKLVVEDKLGRFFVAEEMLLEENDCLKRQVILKKKYHVFKDVRWVTYAFYVHIHC